MYDIVLDEVVDEVDDELDEEYPYVDNEHLDELDEVKCDDDEVDFVVRDVIIDLDENENWLILMGHQTHIEVDDDEGAIILIVIDEQGLDVDDLVEKVDTQLQHIEVDDDEVERGVQMDDEVDASELRW